MPNANTINKNLVKQKILEQIDIEINRIEKYSFNVKVEISEIIKNLSNAYRNLD